MTRKSLVSVPIDEYVVLWLEDLNKYIVVSPLAAEIVSMLYIGSTEDDIVQKLQQKYSLSFEESESLLSEVEAQLTGASYPNTFDARVDVDHPKDLSLASFPIIHYYRFWKKLVCIEYASEYLAYLIHPKISHLEVEEHSDAVTKIQLLRWNEQNLMYVNSVLKWQWKPDEELFLIGKVSMEILNAMYSKNDEDWLAVFHAAGVSNGMECIAFAGECGAGKSTLSALALAKGFDVLADDFLPMDVENLEVFAFPAAIALKGNVIEKLDAEFPLLKDMPGRSICRSGKPMRYLSGMASFEKPMKPLPCSKIVFVRYETGLECTIQEIDKLSAIQALVPETWVSPRADHAERFLNWLKGVRFYQMHYGDNELMLESMLELFSHEV